MEKIGEIPMWDATPNTSEEDLLNFIQWNYCVCDVPPSCFQPASNSAMNQDLFAPVAQGKNKRVSIEDISLERSAQRMYEALNAKPCDLSATVVFSKKKHERRKRSNRRSHFIGVSKNGPSWQAMITVNRRKTYIGTYKDERDAAIAFDFYSMLIHNMMGKTNLSYTKGQLYEMLDNFSKNNQILDVQKLNF